MSNFDKKRAGLQIDWREDEEIEYFGPRLLQSPHGARVQTAATAKRGRSTISYLYPAAARRDGRVLRFTYKVNPTQWPATWDWEVCPGEVAIHFKSESFEPERVMWTRFEPREEPDELIRGEDWEYFAPQVPTSVPDDTVRKRVLTSRLERLGQAALRMGLISERGACQLSGTRCTTVLEACHIVAVKDAGGDGLQNALLLRSDLHALFDAGLLRLERGADYWRVKLDSSVDDVHYQSLLEKQIPFAALDDHQLHLAQRARLLE